MADTKTIDERHNTKGGGTIRLETWQDAKTGKVVRYTMAYTPKTMAEYLDLITAMCTQAFLRGITAIGLGELLRTGSSSPMTSHSYDSNVF
jgi:hypothetical protein